MAAREESTRMSPDVIDGTFGASAELRNRLGDEDVTDEQLVARVRSELGHHVERARAIEVVADHGKVILRGQASPDELDDVVTTVRRVRGVEQVENQLRVHAP
jgi:osmotically-inducible protein OsmY